MAKNGWEYEIILVNDGSTDNTLEIMNMYKNDPRIIHVKHSKNLGYGAALRSGFRTATKDWVFIMDADRQFDIRDLDKFEPYSPSYDAIVGYRYERKDSFSRKLNARIYKIAMRLLFGIEVRDIDCAFKLIKRSVLDKLELVSSGAFISSELFIRLKVETDKVIELPVNHRPRLYGKSTGSKGKVVLRAMKEVASFFQSEYKWPLSIFLISRLIVFIVFVVVAFFHSGQFGFAQWDALRYFDIANHGYIFHGVYDNTGIEIAFFPLFPLVIAVLNWLTGFGLTAVSLLFNLICGLVATVLLYKIVREYFDEKVAIISVLFLSVYPSSIHLTVPYTESLFLLLVLLFFRGLQKGNRSMPLIALSLALVTRMTGFLLIPFFIWKFYFTKGVKSFKNTFRIIAELALACMPFLGYLIYQVVIFGTPFAFLKAQGIGWHHYAVWPWTGILDMVNRALYDRMYASIWWVDMFFTILVIITLLLSYRKIPKPVWYFGLLVFLLTFSSSYILGVPRYLMVCIPLYFYWALILEKHRVALYTITAVSLIWLCVNTVLYSYSMNIF
jgi:glycosyltransferase involved in cell wall biosynthesis